MAGLPYDRTPTPEPVEVSGPSTTRPSALDMALDDYEPKAEPVPEHVQSLMGRMSKGKVYLLEESPAILHVDGKERVRGDPRIANLAAQLDLHDPTEWLLASVAASPSPIRPLALFVRSDNIKHLSTAKVFSWSTGLGADVMGIEWLNDETLLLIFRSPAATLLGLSMLAKAGFDPAEGDDPLLERSAHSIPISLLPQAELDPEDSKAGEELLAEKPADESGGIRKRGRGTFTTDTGGRFEPPPLAPVAGDNKFNLAPGVDANARIAIRYAMESDGALRKDAKQSEWYQRHGRHAGKERSSAPRNFGGEREREDVSWSGRGQGEGREFAKRIGRERRGPYDRPPRRSEGPRGGGRRTADDLDRELENMSKRRQGGEDGGDGMDGMDVDMEAGVDAERSDRRPRRRERRGKDDLDKELEDMFAARTSAPA